MLLPVPPSNWPKSPKDQKCSGVPVDLTYVNDQSGFDPTEFLGDLLYWSYDIDSLDDFNPNNLLGCNECVGQLVLHSHGRYSESTGQAQILFGDAWINLTDESIDQLFGDIKFCCDCHMELRVCWIGQMYGLNEKLENLTNCSVRLHSGLCNPWGDDL